MLEVIACLAVVQAAQNLGVTSAQCKWPNDVWVRGHKLAGFLSENGNHRRRVAAGEQEESLVILGVGINVNADPRRDSLLAPIATSLRCELGGAHVSREKFLANVCSLLEERLEWPVETCFQAFAGNNVFHPMMCVSVHDYETSRNFEATFGTFEEDWDITLTGDSRLNLTQIYYNSGKNALQLVLYLHVLSSTHTTPSPFPHHPHHSCVYKCKCTHPHAVKNVKKNI